MSVSRRAQPRAPAPNQVARNGEEAVQAVQWDDNQGLAMFDIVLMDCNMPVLDGFGAARAIRTWERERG